MSTPEPNIVVTTTIIAGAILFISTIIGITWYTASSGNYVPNNQASQSKMTVLNEALHSALGPRWPFVLLAFMVMLGIILVLFYNISSNPIQLNLSEQGTKIFTYSMVAFVILFAVFIVVLAIRQYLKYSQQQSNGGNIPNYIPNNQQNKQNMQILAIVGLGLFVLLAGGYGIYYMISKRDSKQA